MSFTPDQTKQEAKKVPYFEEATAAEGWKGHTTTKSIKILQAQIKTAIERMDGYVDRFVFGQHEVNGQLRQGFQLYYVLPGPEGRQFRGRMDIAALPVKDKWNVAKKEKSLRMALYMVCMALEGAWFLEVLAPGFSVLMPGLLVDKEGHTVSDLYTQGMTDHLLPPGEAFQESEEVVEAEVKEIK
jgi:hypothetical protein